MSVFTDIGCIPLTMSSTTTKGWTTLSIFHRALGNTNPPNFCDGAQLEAAGEADTFFAALKWLTKEIKGEQ
ncbi:hypothetical protein NHX12_018797 [Muraenolepis orangiensis]|uniref:Uncharacterized protein n=1 Tax=Muraenolepis orangiensis TaxID=630683 RepID=A0A9Q0EXY5_9TELE|nr:hypothetical protein NHX12_018797 [Muraenolepis orangiensis]